MTTSENIQEEYTMSKYVDMASLYLAMCDEIALLRNLVAQKATIVVEDTTPEATPVLPEQQFTKTVYVKVKGVKGYEVHQYTNNIEEDNSTIINNVKKDLKSDKVDVVSVFIAEKL